MEVVERVGAVPSSVEVVDVVPVSPYYQRVEME